MGDAYQSITDLFDNLIHDSQGEMYEYCNFCPEDIRVSAPEFLIELFKKALTHKYMMANTPPSGKDFIYRGLTFVPCYEMAVSVWHKDYPLYKKDWMLRKIPLDSPYKTSNGLYNELIINLRAGFPGYIKVEIKSTYN